MCQKKKYIYGVQLQYRKQKEINKHTVHLYKEVRNRQNGTQTEISDRGERGNETRDPNVTDLEYDEHGRKDNGQKVIKR